MKIKTIGITTLSILFSSQVYSKTFWKSSLESLKDYGVPCALAIGASQLLVKEDKMAIGMVACAGVSGVTYLKNKEMKELRKDNAEVKKEISRMSDELKTEVKRTIVGDAKSEMIAEMKMDIYSQINESLRQDKEFIGQMLTGIKSEFTEYKQVIDQVLAEKLVDFRGEMSLDIEKALIEGPFISLLEEKLKIQMEQTHADVFEKNKEDIVKKCVEDALNEIVVKEIGVQR